MTVLKSNRELALMQKAGDILARILEKLSVFVQPGNTAKVLDQEARKLFRNYRVKPAFLGYRGYPAAICVSVNDVVVHGIPGSVPFREGDIVSIDLGCVYEGYCSDMAKTFFCGTPSKEAKKLVEVTERSLQLGIEQARMGNRTGDIGSAVQYYVESFGYSVVRDLVGHGIGKALHEDPQVPNFGEPGKGELLQPGMSIAIEPMVNLGGSSVYFAEDGWTVRTKDGTLSAHFEHTVAITQNGAKILTMHE